MTLGGHLLLSWTLVLGSTAEIEPGTCASVADPGQPLHGAPLAPPRVRGEPFEVPALWVRLRPRVDEHAEYPSVTVCYDWRWFSFPHPEKLFGAWSASYQCRPCRPDSKGELFVSAHTVVPTGWYDGWLRFGRSPRFQGLRFELGQASTQTFASLTRRDVKRLREGKATGVRAESPDWRLDAKVAPDR